MKRKTVSINSLIILISLVALIIEVCVYYLTTGSYGTVVVSFIAALGISYYCLEASYDYNYGFVNVVFMTVSSFLIAGALYLFGTDLIDYRFSLVYVVLGNWVIPFVFSTLREVNDVADRFSGYEKYFRRMVRFFLVFYVFIIIKQFFITPIVPPFQLESFGAHNFIPYMSTGQYFETALRQGIPLRDEYYYLIELICMGFPAGFLIAYSRKNMHMILRILLYIAIPVALELVQYAYGVGVGMIDDVCTFLVGEILGIIIYHLLDAVYMYNHKRHFMESKDSIKGYFIK